MRAWLGIRRLYFRDIRLYRLDLGKGLFDPVGFNFGDIGPRPFYFGGRHIGYGSLGLGYFGLNGLNGMDGLHLFLRFHSRLRAGDQRGC
jgi:hypothetical protein